MQEDTPIGCALIRHWNKKDVQRVCTYMKTIDYDECKGDWFTMGNFHNIMHSTIYLIVHNHGQRTKSRTSVSR